MAQADVIVLRVGVVTKGIGGQIFQELAAAEAESPVANQPGREPRSADVIVLEEPVAPGVPVQDVAVGLNQQTVGGLDVLVKLQDAEIAVLLKAGQGRRQELDRAKISLIH